MPGIICDSTACLSDEQVRANRLNVVSLWVNDDGDTQRELDMDHEAFFARLADMQQLPTSSQPSPEEMMAAMRQALAEGDGEAIGVFLSSKMSGTFESARLAADLIIAEQPDARIELIDSKSNCMQAGFAVLDAARASAAGESMERCVEAAQDCMRRTRFLFTPQTMEYLRRGGRVGNAAALLGGLLQIVPVLTVEDGVTSVAAKVRTRKKALAEMVTRFSADIEAHGLRDVVVHSIADLEAAKAFARDHIAPIAGREVPVVPIGPVIGLHVGPTVGLAYATERPLRSA